MRYSDIAMTLRSFSSPARAASNARFFKTGLGEYAEDDVFLGISMPDVRRVVRQFRGASLRVVSRLCSSRFHEERMCGLLMIVDAFERGDSEEQRKWFLFYIEHRAAVNNWDLVDVTTPKVVGVWLLDHPDDMQIIDTLIILDSVWERRMAMLAMQAFINAGRLREPIRVAERLLQDEHDLIHKAVGWMLREIGKKDVHVLKVFLDKHAKIMPRTMLRYAIEKFSARERRSYLGR